MLNGLLVFFGAGLGGLARYGAGDLLHRWAPRSFPWGTLAVNVLGCFAMGVLMYLFDERQALGERQRAFLMVGLLGGFTTFSSFGWEWFALWRDGRHGAASLYAAASLLLSLGAVVAGRASAKLAGW